MPLADFQRLVLRLANQAFVRYALWLNYPNDPQLMGIDFGGNPESVNTMLREELTRLGLAIDPRFKMWTVERTDLEL